jgi:hypothetical protein
MGLSFPIPALRAAALNAALTDGLGVVGSTAMAKQADRRQLSIKITPYASTVSRKKTKKAVRTAI